jgi:pyridoxal phosphate enzyme (YggS family)
MSIVENVARVHGRIISAAHRSARNPDDIELMAVTKTVSADRIRQAYAAGIRLFGENRVQEFESKRSALADLADAHWNMIGHLQTNKATKAAELFSAVESVDSVRVAQKLNSTAQQLGKQLAVLIEINIGGESAKSGLASDSQELNDLLSEAPTLTALAIGGLMTVPPFYDDPEQSRPFFRRMRELATSIRNRNLPNISMDTLSMGMSHDFEIAVDEGSTRVRLGTAIFGERTLVRSKA